MRILRLLVLLVLGLSAAACQPASDGTSKVVPSMSAEQKPSLSTVAGASGFMVGNPQSKRTVYVLFDAQCPHCGQLWRDSQAFWPAATFIWIPVGLINKASVLQGAALLQAHSVNTMDAHELALQRGQGGMDINAAEVPRQFKDAVESNTEVLERFGVERVPFVVGEDERTGKMVTIEGDVSAASLPSRLGWAD